MNIKFSFSSKHIAVQSFLKPGNFPYTLLTWQGGTGVNWAIPKNLGTEWQDQTHLHSIFMGKSSHVKKKKKKSGSLRVTEMQAVGEKTQSTMLR